MDICTNHFTRYLCLVLLSAVAIQSTTTMTSPAKIRYVALGDSYTICEGALIEESWPVVLSKHLREKGIDIELVANPSITGWTTQNLIDRELSIFDSSNPTFATLLIGVNDWVQKVDKEKFHYNLNYIIDHVLKKLPNKKNLVLITIPDFSATVNGAKYGGGRDITEGIKEFNSIITVEANKRGLKLVDIFPTTQQMKSKAELVSGDGLHPSAKEYGLWEKLILPVVYDLLK
jgi:lysophospholipase L1-like esterase